MDGFNLFLISGIDGDFNEFDLNLKDNIECVEFTRFEYNRNKTFQQNRLEAQKIISGSNDKCIVLGWSIGAVLSLFIAENENVLGVIAINPFFDRADVLNRRNIVCDEQVSVSTSKLVKKPILIINGAQDDKILPTESERIVNFYEGKFCTLFSFPYAKHSLTSFPKYELSSLINKTIESWM